MSVIQYVIDGNFPEDAYFLDPEVVAETTSQRWFEVMAQNAADDYWFNHDGWESSWPLDVEIYVDGKSKGVFSVSMEAVPQFSATLKKD